MNPASAREEVRRLLGRLPGGASWDDMQYSLYDRQRIERGIREAAEGKVIDHALSSIILGWIAE